MKLHKPTTPSFRRDEEAVRKLSPEQFRDVFASDVPIGEARVMAATQKPINGASFGASVDDPAWKTIPSWYLVASDDRAIKPEVERFMAKRMGAHTTEIKSSHVPFISHPKEVAKLIDAAAKASGKP